VPNDNGVPRQSPAASQPQVKREQQELLLINKNLGLNLVIRPGDVVGRSEGRLSHALQNYKTISRRHCLFNYESGRGWSVTDLGSTNGVKYENKLLAPYQPHPLRPRSFLVIGNVEFFVEIPAENDPDQTWRVGSI
jgi:pSer/pThr/pTyr-binding forkhead associated (FHA) protein